MKSLVLGGLAVVVLLAFGFWLYRGLEAFRYELLDFGPTPYDAHERSRALRERARSVTEEVGWVLADGSRQVAYYLAPRNGAVIVYAHGSPGNALGLLRGEPTALAEAGYGALLVDLPGYGASEGQRTWDARYVETVRRAVDFLSARPEVDPRRIGAFGYSNGGCVVARAAAEDERLRALVLLASYTTFAEHLHHAFRSRLPGLGYFAIAAARWAGVPVEELDSVSALRRMTPRPLLVVWGGRDQAIAPWMGPVLKSAVPGAEGIEYASMGHWGYAEELGGAYIGRLERFYAQSLGLPESAREPSVSRVSIDSEAGTHQDESERRG
ncbi:MAG: alpha/beta fold hydrolase [Spirochaetaceae bacterium]|nr:alpha/beta fold hydrolase [Myxococcales bacterium]MCB9725329.1 alpha/beta fold hydrolase [Spirochaetaceae bacterium]HPG25208.1 alpha/beta fold hydrolase [Myxococcota bacterium]